MSFSNAVFHHFLAIRPDAATSERIATERERLRSRHGLRGSLRPMETFHVSLHNICDDELPHIIQHAVSSACGTVAAITPPFEIAFDQVVCFPRNSRAMVLKGDKSRNAGLAAFHRALGLELRGRCNGVLKFALSTSHHLTLLYGDQELKESIEPVIWSADEFMLVRSHVGDSRYEPLESWKLRGKPESLSTGDESPAHPRPIQTELPLD